MHEATKTGRNKGTRERPETSNVRGTGDVGIDVSSPRHTAVGTVIGNEEIQVSPPNDGSPTESSSPASASPATDIARRLTTDRRPRTQLDPAEVLRTLKPYITEIKEPAAMAVRDLDLFYGTSQALWNISLDIPAKKVTAFIGPSGCGKSTLLRSLNRMNDLIDDVRITGTIELEGKNINDRDVDVNMLRRRVGMVFQKSNPFPKSIFENVAYGQRIAGGTSNDEIRQIVEDSLQRVGLWSEVWNRLDSSALDLSGGQQQRLCIARAIAISPEIILMDEPCSALDPIATAKVEELIEELKHDYTIVIVTHNMQQAARVSDYTAFMWLGRVVEYTRTDQLFTNPIQPLTEDYITGRFG